MLDDAQHVRTEGQDVVICYFEPHGRLDTISQTEGLEMAPRRKVEYCGTVFQDVDADAIVRRLLGRWPERSTATDPIASDSVR